MSSRYFGHTVDEYMSDFSKTKINVYTLQKWPLEHNYDWKKSFKKKKTENIIFLNSKKKFLVRKNALKCSTKVFIMFGGYLYTYN